MHINSLFNTILNILFPPTCISCKREGDFLCTDCLNKLNKKKISKYKSSKLDEDINSLNALIYALDYAKNPIIKSAIQQFKYRFNKDLSEYFADLIIEKLNELSFIKDKKIILIPVPLHKNRLKYRGFNQAKILADKILERINLNTEIIELLERKKETKQQAKLTASERRKNLESAFVLNKKCVHKYSNKNIYFIIDDVFTTGATIESCASLLKENNFLRVYGLVIARAFK